MSSPRRGEVWWCDHPEVGRRPVVVLSRDAALAGRRRALVAPCTTRFRGLPSDVELDPSIDPVPRDCVANLDAVEQVSVALLTERVGALSPSRMRQMCDALAVAAGCG